MGGGHSHALLLRRLAMYPLPGVRITLVSESSLSPYSGMLPGLIAGHYQVSDSHIDLWQLCRHANSRFVRDRASGLDCRNQTLLLSDGEPLHYDWLSLDIGATPDLDSVPGARQFATPVKPVAGFRQRWQNLLEEISRQPDNAAISVVGGGAGGVEMLFAIEQRLQREGIQASLQLLTGGPLLPGYPSGLRKKVYRLLQQRQIRLHENQRISEVTASQLISENGEQHNYRFLLWCTGARAADWLGASDLATTEENFVRVGHDLRSLSADNVFAAGDCAWIEQAELPRAGVYAVRQAPVLADNLAAAVRGEKLRQYRPQRHFLSLLSAGNRYALGSRGSLSMAGGWVWRWKDRIDRKFMQQFSDLKPAMATMQDDASAPMHCAGCGSKVGPEALQEALRGLHSNTRPEIMADFRAGEDAAIMSWPAGQLLLQSQDYFPAFIDEPYLFGRIAALHALSDLHAMNARAHSTLATISVAYNHPRLQSRDLHQLMAGALRELNREHCTLLGGHTIEGPQMAAGFMVNGSAESGTLLRKGGAKPGHRLVMTKPLGTGILLAGLMHGKTRGPWLDAALESMLTSNADSATLLARYGASACTDITGFGLLGHLLEILDASGVQARLDSAAIAPLPGSFELLGQGIHSTLRPANDSALVRCEIPAPLQQHPRLALLTDPQTSGGLLATLPVQQLSACREAMANAGIVLLEIGECLETDSSLASIRLH